MTVTHATFTLERTYQAPPARVFAAWADPAAKARWFATPGGEHELDFRVGGRETNRARPDGTDKVLTFESWYRDIVTGHRIIYTSTLYDGAELATVSLTTVEFTPADGATLLTLTEHGTFLDGREDPDWRRQGTGDWLDALGADLRRDEP
ncbi:activator of HSP90 ATPase [Microtetraspora sp. NBRC 13810]|uniref:SRPBCC domain-containing protein n=1 Tax=Microtetraspora sp. NBRC 13810 TaxID=3030990 RepID=UPI0024A3C97A|nr:SRPBCC domain-containing protein [Microtetraspora sp. NBRC 13810]GLW11356.1 activator of HSP90 ATPase [Microtetraspora sp. NBRC 13810]